MLSVIIPSVIMLSVIVLSIILLILWGKNGYLKKYYLKINFICLALIQCLGKEGVINVPLSPHPLGGGEL
jgi:hypothetical protein